MKQKLRCHRWGVAWELDPETLLIREAIERKVIGPRTKHEHQQNRVKHNQSSRVARRQECMAVGRGWVDGSLEAGGNGICIAAQGLGLIP